MERTGRPVEVAGNDQNAIDAGTDRACKKIIELRRTGEIAGCDVRHRTKTYALQPRRGFDDCMVGIVGREIDVNRRARRQKSTAELLAAMLARQKLDGNSAQQLGGALALAIEHWRGAGHAADACGRRHPESRLREMM